MLQEVGRTRSSGTVRNLKIVASEMFRIAVQNKLRDDNRVAGIKVRARPGRSMVIATREQARAIEEAIEPHYRLLVRTLFATGCRWGEAIALCGTDVERRGSGYVLKIRRTVSEVRGKPYLKPYGKTATAVRDITIPGELALELLAYGDHLCFVGPRKGKFLIRANFWHRWRRAVEAAGITGLRVHDARHSHLSWLANDPRVPLAAVRDRAGHSSLSVTSKYVHVIPGDEDPCLAALREAA